MNTAIIHQSSRQGTAFPPPAVQPPPMAEWLTRRTARQTALGRIVAKVLGRG